MLSILTTGIDGILAFEGHMSSMEFSSDARWALFRDFCFKAGLHYSCCLCIRTVWKGLERAISNRSDCEALLYHGGHLFLVS